MELDHKKFMKRACALAKKSYDEGGCPIGAMIVDNNTGEILGEGHNMLVQEGNPILHGEMSAMRNAGRIRHQDTTMYTTLSPCFMCTGTIIQHQIPRVVVVGDTVNASGNEKILRERGIEVIVLDAPDCIALTAKFREEKPQRWEEDWGA